MNIIHRRSFLRGSGLGAMAIALGVLNRVPGYVREAVAADAVPGGTDKKLLFIWLRGGNDGLNMVVPGGDPAYYTSRPSIAIPLPDDPLTTGGAAPVTPQAGRGIDLGNGFAMLHSSMADLIPLYNQGELAVIHRVGYPFQSRSHFDSQNYWENGLPGDDSTHSGIFYRALVELGLHHTHALPGVSTSSSLPLMLRGAIPMANINNPGRYDLQGVVDGGREKEMDALQRAYSRRFFDKQNRPASFATGDRFVQSLPEVAGVDFTDNDSAPFLDTDGTHLFPVDSDSNDKGFSSSSYSFFRQVKYACQLLSDTDNVVAGVELGGFDTHNNQGSVDGGHAERMAWLSWALYAIKTYLNHASTDCWKNTLALTLSEFGRTTVENGSNGTDHAEAGPMFIAGPDATIAGGVYECGLSGGLPCDGSGGSRPWCVGPTGALFEVNGRYLSRTLDYRSVLGEVIRNHLGANEQQLQSIIPGYALPDEFLASGGIAPDGVLVHGEPGIVL